MAFRTVLTGLLSEETLKYHTFPLKYALLYV